MANGKCDECGEEFTDVRWDLDDEQFCSAACMMPSLVSDAEDLDG